MNDTSRRSGMHRRPVLQTHEAHGDTTRPRSPKRSGHGARPSQPLARRKFRSRLISATNASVRTSGQKDAPIDEHDARPAIRRRRELRAGPPVGVERHLPWGSVPFDGINIGDRYAPDCLPDAFRSQRFSRSQRFDPTDALWLCFTPHPSLGFRPSELFPRRQPSCLSTRDALLSFLHAVTPTEIDVTEQWRLQSVAPTTHSTPVPACLALEQAAALLTFHPSEACRSRPLATGLPSRASPARRATYEYTHASARLRLRVCRPGTGSSSRKPLQPP
jgi:hypothetical protein